MKSATVYYRDIPAGTIAKDAKGYVFRYGDDYFRDSSLPAVSATLPKSRQEYRSPILFPFFFGDLCLILVLPNVTKSFQNGYVRLFT